MIGSKEGNLMAALLFFVADCVAEGDVEALHSSKPMPPGR